MIANGVEWLRIPCKWRIFELRSTAPRYAGGRLVTCQISLRQGSGGIAISLAPLAMTAFGAAKFRTFAMIHFEPSAESAISRVGFVEESEVERKYRKVRVYLMTLMSTNLSVCHIAKQVPGLPPSYCEVRA